MNFPEHFPKIPEDCRRLPKTFKEDPKMFQSYTNELKNNLKGKLHSMEIIDILASDDDLENASLETRM